MQSAKSWLSHPGVDRRAPILPLGAPEDVEKISPVEASWRYLEHLAEAWEATVAKGDAALAWGAQDIVLTVPASFDAAARDLTVEAAKPPASSGSRSSRSRRPRSMRGSTRRATRGASR